MSPVVNEDSLSRLVLPLYNIIRCSCACTCMEFTFISYHYNMIVLHVITIYVTDEAPDSV